MRRSFWFLIAAAAAVPCGASAADFYKGKQVSLIITLPPGGGYDLNARVVARHIGRHPDGICKFR